MINLTINGKPVSVEEGTTIMEAAKSIGIEIPNLCYDKTLSPFGGCRLCVVQIEGNRKLESSCTTRCREGMNVTTESERLTKIRRDILDLLYSNHPHDCLTCDKVGECKLQDYCYKYDVKDGSFIGDVCEYPIDDHNPVMIRNQSKCIKCGKCVRVCKEIQVTTAIEFVDRGFTSFINTGNDLPLNTENCRFCGQCISVCPTAALLNNQLMKTRPWEVKKVTTTCPFCGTGCQFDLNVKNGKVVGVTPNPDSVVNQSSLCIKGRFHVDMIHSEERLTKPLIRVDGEFQETTWEHAMQVVADNLTRIRDTYGPDSLTALSSARCTNEDNYVMQKFMRAVIGTNNVDHCART